MTETYSSVVSFWYHYPPIWKYFSYWSYSKFTKDILYSMLALLLKSAHIVKIFIFPSDPIFHAINFYEFLKTWKSCFLAVYPCRWSQDWHAQSCDVDSGTCDFRLNLSHLFYLCKFSFVVHAKCSFPAFCINYLVKFTEEKGKTGNLICKFSLLQLNVAHSNTSFSFLLLTWNQI